MADDIDPVLAALQAMARAGASDRLLGAAVREWTPAAARSAPFVAVAPSPLAAPTRPPPPATPPVVRTAPAGSAVPKNASGPEIVNFTDSEGKKSSVSFTAEEWSQLLARHNGDSAAARAAVRATAPNAPPSERRSRWTKQQLLGSATDAA